MPSPLKMPTHDPRRCRFLLLAGLLCAAPLHAQQQAPSPLQALPSEPVTELEKFIASESAVGQGDSTLPDSRGVDGIIGDDRALVDIPRSVTVLTRQAMDEYGIHSFADLGRVGAGTQQPNFYGVPGTPSLRGAKGSTFLNGMQRAYQRNEMPLSFGSAEGIDLVKGPAPAHFGPGLVGGYANLLPKSPFFDRRRGSLRLTLGSDDLYQAQLDLGGPFLLAGRPSAYRLSLSGQLAGSYYDRIRNDTVSLYGALKSRLARDLTLFTGAEFFHYRSNENAGWNRPTQQLIDKGLYVIGEALNITSPAYGGTVDRNALSSSTALVVPRSVVDAAVFSGALSAAQRSALNDLSTQAGRLAAYGANSPFLANDNGGGYQYTKAYLDAGGRVFTTPVSGRNVLSDTRDFANSDNLLWFADLISRRAPDLPLRAQTLVDWVSTDKLSTYGYSSRTRQFVFEQKATVSRDFPLLRGLAVQAGASVRYTDATLLQDYSLEPFGRRDITLPEVSSNTVLLTGAQKGPDGLNYWSPSAVGGANVSSRLWQFSLFTSSELRASERLTLHLSGRLAHAPFRTWYPDEVDRATPAQRAAVASSDHKNYGSLGVSPVLRLAEGLNAYATLQRGTSLDATQGGAIFGRGNFSRSDLDETGLKYSNSRYKLSSSLAFFRWTQDQFDVRTVSPELLRGRGWEYELAFAPTESLTLSASTGWQRVRRFRPLTLIRSMPLSEQQWALPSTPPRAASPRPIPPSATPAPPKPSTSSTHAGAPPAPSPSPAARSSASPTGRISTTACASRAPSSGTYMRNRHSAPGPSPPPSTTPSTPTTSSARNPSSARTPC